MILAIDQGTSATKACLFEAPAHLIGSCSVPVGCRRARDGAVTQDPRELVESCVAAARQALGIAGVNANQVEGAVLANQGESFLLFDDEGPLTPVISWQDSRCGDVLERVARQPGPEAVAARTGLPLHAEFVAPKLAHHLSQVEAGRLPLRAGTLDTWLIHELDPDRPYVTDRATASRTMLIGLRDDDWSRELTDWFGVPREVLPEIVPCDAPGAVLRIDGSEVPLLISGYDMGLALIGHGCFSTGETKATFGTCLGVMAATGDRAVRADGLLTTIAYTRGARSAYALDGEIAAAGALISWAIQMRVAGSLEELAALAESVPTTSGVVVVPAIQGLGAPYWRDDVRGSIVGLTAATGRAELARAVFDAIAWSLRDVLERMRGVGMRCGEVRVDGGLSRCSVLLQRCADVCGIEIVVGAQPEATAYGAAALAMLAGGSATDGDVRRAAAGVGRFTLRSEPTDEELHAWRDALHNALRT